jgi:hypothetical protein
MARIPKPVLRKPEVQALPPGAMPPPPDPVVPTTLTERIVAQGQAPDSAPLAPQSAVDEVLGRETAPQPLGGPRAPWRNVNTDRLDTPEGVDQLLDAVSVSTENAGYVRRTDAKVMAEAAAIPDREMLGLLMTRKPGQTLSDAQLTKARGLMVTSATDLQKWGADLEKRGRGSVSQLELVDYQRALYRHSALQSAVQGVTRDTARALRALQLVPDKFDPQAIEEALRNGGGPDAIFEKARTISRAKTVEEASRQAGRVGWLRSAADKLVYYRTMSLLTGPKTHVVNALSNSLVNLMAIPERAVAGVISRSPIGSGQIFPQEAAEMFYGDISNVMDALSLAKRALKTGESVFGGTQIETPNAVHSASEYGLNHRSPQAVAYDYLASFVSAPGRALTGADEFYKTLAFNQQMRALAYRTARQEGLTDAAAISSRIDEILAGPNQEKIIEKLNAEGIAGDDFSLEMAGRVSAEERLFKSLYRESLDFSRYQTFTDSIVSDVGRGLSDIHRASPLVRMVVPFYRTPANILSYAVERSPMFVAAPNFWRSVQAGGAKRDEAMARAVIGTAFASWAISAVVDGSLTGSGPPNPQLRKVYEAAGWKPYTINGVSYGRMDPLSTPLGVIADMSDAYRYATSDKQREHILVVMSAALAETMSEKAMLTGVSDFVDAIQAGRFGGDTNYTGRLAASFVPYSAMLRTVRQTIDGEQRETSIGPLESAWAYVRNQIPIPALYDDLPPKLDFWGQPMTSKDFIGPDLLSPFYMAKYQDDDATYALAQNGVAPSGVSCEFSQDGVAIDLHAIDTGKGPGWACHDYRQFVGEERRRAVENMVGDSRYRNLPQGGANASGAMATRGDALTAALTAGTNAGRARFIERYRTQVQDLFRSGQGNVRPVSPAPAFIEQGRDRERQRRAGSINF